MTATDSPAVVVPQTYSRLSAIRLAHASGNQTTGAQHRRPVKDSMRRPLPIPPAPDSLALSVDVQTTAHAPARPSATGHALVQHDWGLAYRQNPQFARCSELFGDHAGPSPSALVLLIRMHSATRLSDCVTTATPRCATAGFGHDQCTILGAAESARSRDRTCSRGAGDKSVTTICATLFPFCLNQAPQRGSLHIPRNHWVWCSRFLGPFTPSLPQFAWKRLLLGSCKLLNTLLETAMHALLVISPDL